MERSCGSSVFQVGTIDEQSVSAPCRAFAILHRKLLRLFKALTRMVLRDKEPLVVPKSCGGKMSCLFLVLVPMLGALSLAGFWVYKSQKCWDVANSREAQIQATVLQIGRVIMDFNIEREVTSTYVTARAEDVVTDLKAKLDRAQERSDQSVADMLYWPGSVAEGQMFKSGVLFNAVLARHRELILPNLNNKNSIDDNNYFCDEVQFYTDIIDVMFGWLHKETNLSSNNSELWKWLVSYSYLMGSINYVGAEQALCTVFHSIICFSHRETLYYANYSFGGEAVFRLYRQTFPGDRKGGWRTQSHHSFFPQLAACREEIYADLDYLAMSRDTSRCDSSVKNETQFQETDVLMVDEHGRIVDALTVLIQQQVNRTALEFLLSGIVFGGAICYVILLHIIRCTCIKCVQMRKVKKWRPKDTMPMTDDKMDCDHIGLNTDHMSLQATPTTNIYRYEDYNCKPNSIKVATV